MMLTQWPHPRWRRSAGRPRGQVVDRVSLAHSARCTAHTGSGLYNWHQLLTKLKGTTAVRNLKKGTVGEISTSFVVPFLLV